MYAAVNRVNAAIARTTLSMRSSPGKKSGSMICIMNRIVTSGTPRTSSI